MHHVAVRITEHLHLDVAGPGDEALDQQCVVTEGSASLAPSGGDRLEQSAGLPHDAHSLATTTCRRLEEDRIADLLRCRNDVLVAHSRIVATRNHRHSCSDGGLLRADLVAHRLEGRNGWSDEDDPRSFQCQGEFDVLRQEAIPGMHSVCTADPRSLDDAVDVQVALDGRCRADADSLVGEPHMRGIRVSLAENRNAAQPHASQGPDDPHCDLTSIGDEDPGESHVGLRHRQLRCHRHHIRKTP